MNPVPLFLIIVTLPLLLGGCGEEPVVEVKPVEEKVLEVKEEVKPEKLVAKDKPAKEAPVSPNLKYEIKGDAVTITNCDGGASGKLVIPDTIEGNPVTSIGSSAFDGCKNLTSITIPDSVTSVGRVAFQSCSSLTSVTFLGDAPKEGNEVFIKSNPTIYRKPEAKGWGDTWAGRPVKLISEKP